MVSVLASHKIERDELLGAPTVPRAGLREAAACLGSGLVKVVTGPRRAGKSVFALQMLSAVGGDFAYVNFDDERLVPPLDLDELLKALVQVYGETKILFFDEIQNVSGWELFVNRLHRRGYNVVLTGSNAHLLSRELTTHLTGRYREFRLLPFSFAEYLTCRKFELDDRLAALERQGQLLLHLTEYLQQGGFPEVVLQRVEGASYLSTLFDGVLFKDVVRRYGVRYPAKLHDLGRWMVNNAAREYTCTSLKNSLAFRSVHTVENYVSYLLEAFLFLSVERYSPKTKLRLTAPRKVYAIDTGMVHAVRFRAGADTGRILENAVAVELFRRGATPYSYKTSGGKEVDFLIRRTGAPDQLVQVCHDLSDPKTRRRELEGLARAGEELGLREGTVLTWDEAGEAALGPMRVRLVPAWMWFLEEDAAVRTFLPDISPR